MDFRVEILLAKANTVKPNTISRMASSLWVNDTWIEVSCRNIAVTLKIPEKANERRKVATSPGHIKHTFCASVPDIYQCSMLESRV